METTLDTNKSDFIGIDNTNPAQPVLIIPDSPEFQQFLRKPSEQGFYEFLVTKNKGGILVELTPDLRTISEPFALGELSFERDPYVLPDLFYSIVMNQRPEPLAFTDVLIERPKHI